MQNNQEIKADAGKPKLSLVPSQIIRDIAQVREYGNQKYHDSNSWKQVEIERYRDALYRHLLAYIDDPAGVDEESGIEHYKHMACNMAFLCELERGRGGMADTVDLKSSDASRVGSNPTAPTINI